MRMFFTYRGALFWRMTAGMGDIVFAPLYEVLKRRGVRFEFFHRLRDVKLSPEAEGEPAYVAALELDVQAKVKGGREYQPLVDVERVPSWPSRPRYEQLVNGAALEREGRAFESPWDKRRAGTKTLRVKEDFDFVVLGIGVGAIPHVCGELLVRDPRWRAMTDHVKTVGTQAFQVWMREDMKSLGWKHPPVNLSGYVEPFDTWADMSHLAQRESWSRPVKSIAYFCSVLPEGGRAADGEDAQIAARERVREGAVRFLERDVGALWPGAVDEAGRFRWEVLAEEGERAAAGRRGAGEKRFDTQFWTANVAPSERYTLSVPGSLKYRISPLDMRFDNLTIAGDWTQTGLDSGCVESAVMSGLLAAHAIAHSPALESVVGYDHPWLRAISAPAGRHESRASRRGAGARSATSRWHSRRRLGPRPQPTFPGRQVLRTPLKRRRARRGRRNRAGWWSRPSRPPTGCSRNTCVGAGRPRTATISRTRREDR